jgi:hypothetical protein
MYLIHPPVKCGLRDNRPGWGGGVPAERHCQVSVRTIVNTVVAARHTFPSIHKSAPEVTTAGQRFPNIYTRRSSSRTSAHRSDKIFSYECVCVYKAKVVPALN